MKKIRIVRERKPVWTGITAAAKRTGYSRTQIMRHLTGEFKSGNVAKKLQECNIEVRESDRLVRRYQDLKAEDKTDG